jgi:hypothetical protein
VNTQVIISIRRVDGLPWTEGVDAFLAAMGMDVPVVHGDLDTWDGSSLVLWFTSSPGYDTDKLPVELVRRAMRHSIVVTAGGSEVFDVIKRYDIAGAVDSSSYFFATGLGPDLRGATALLGTPPWGLLVPTAVAIDQGLSHYEHPSDERYCAVKSSEPLPTLLGAYLEKYSNYLARLGQGSAE